MESLVSDIPAGDGNVANLFLQCSYSVVMLLGKAFNLVRSHWEMEKVLGLGEKALHTICILFFIDPFYSSFLFCLERYTDRKWIYFEHEMTTQ
jgi:hypothetical protein